MKIINIREKYESFSDYWKPRVIAELNDQQVIIAKVKGEFVWHNHKAEDELFNVIKGKLRMEFQLTVIVLPITHMSESGSMDQSDLF